MQRNPRATEKGSGIVEASLILLVLMLFMLSIFDFGHVLYIHQTLVHQARAAARYGAVHPADTTGITNMVLYSKATGTGSGLLGLTAGNVTITPPDMALNPPRSIGVKISGYKYPLITPGVSGIVNGKPIQVFLPVETD